MAGPTARRPQRRSSPARAAAAAAPAQQTGSAGSTTIPVTVVATPAGAADNSQADNRVVMYGLIVVIVALVALLLSLALIVANSNPTGTSKGLSDPAAFLGIAATAIAGLGGAFFGMALGLQGVTNANRDRAAAEAAKDAVQRRAERYLANLEPSIARNLVE